MAELGRPRRALDNVLVKQLWRSLKYEDIYNRSCEEVPALPPRYSQGSSPSTTARGYISRWLPDHGGGLLGDRGHVGLTREY
jgi:hypothetical protein